MPSNARLALDASKEDLNKLWALHLSGAGSKPGRKFGVEVLNKAIVVFTCAAWEAYCEDIVLEAVTYLIADCSDPSKLPKELKAHIAKIIREDKDDHAPWKMAGMGWKRELGSNAARFIIDSTAWWNTPKSAKVQQLFAKTLGIADITSSWNWKKSSQKQTTDKLDRFVSLRGEIAHRLKSKTPVYKNDGITFFDLVTRLADKIDNSVHMVLSTATGKKYW